ncbi:glycosyltransferase [Flagellimonas meridianipacifica]|uniref:Cellulose synthase/poly-beta-1,6-N-acetylglucosamine synthase-like glycosyltransferase n=1 Tax=Flagellimonas meridianipacifica TaxID=1080225 RepID=A0A2T0MJ13_9FLAO|nr:glycosyltransferase family 2 protein [Allomuricauda pacifica]PRX57580.1 cellulose synthase/poly-beta-1,6-N-acetylglucosamine synthase-like glycosyltransferase [Allomuricauda pacifica]
MEVIRLIVNGIEILLIGYFGFASIYVFVFGFAGLFKAKEKEAIFQKQRKFAVLIPGYKEDAVIVDVAEQALKQTYPTDLYEVIIIADSFQESTLSELRKLPLLVVEVSFEKSTKSKALNKAMEVIGDDYDVALILDADNIMEREFLVKINESFNQGYKVVQGHRVAKNTNTSFAILDAISEEVNNHIFRKGHRVLGFSSALIGSGMAFDYFFFKKMMAQIKAVGGFDKELELELLKKRIKIEYLHEALVLDEKVQKSEVFANQRKRWLSAQFVYFRRYVWDGLKELFAKGNLDFLDKVYQMVSPPRVLLLGLVVVFSLLYLLHSLWPDVSVLMISPILWYASLLFTVLAFVFSVPKKYYNRKTLHAILTLPKAFFLMFLSLFKLKGANKKFIHTEHGTINTP